MLVYLFIKPSQGELNYIQKWINIKEHVEICDEKFKATWNVTLCGNNDGI